MENEKKNYKMGYLVKRFLPYFKKHKMTVIFDLICAALTTVCELALPKIVELLTGKATEDVALLTTDLILKVGIFYLVLRVIDTLANYYMASVGHIMGAAIETDMRRDLFNHLEKLEHSYYDNTKVGQLMSRMTSDLFDVTEFAHHCPEEFFIAGIKIIASFVILSFSNVWLTLIMFAILPLMLVVTKFFNGKMRAGFKMSRSQVGELNAQVEDSLLGIRVVKSFANESIEQEKFNSGNNKFLDIKSIVYKTMASFQSSTRLFDGVMYITIVVCGAFFMKAGTLSAPAFMAFLLYASTLLNSIRRIVEFTEQFQRGMTGIERFIEIMDVEPSITDEEGSVELENVQGDIEFKDVSFKYTEENEDVLSHINLKIEKGTNVAIVGPSGGGKTTICSLIPRFYEINDGSITVDGVDIKHIKLESLRKNIGIVQQDVYLFYGTVRENIEYGKPGATDEEIREAARKAGAEEFISKLPDGYDTYVGERGVKLSGGQKQRISIARVFLKNPPILILDEATSALDNQSERLVQKSLELLAVGRTTLTIAHRLTTIKNADTIIYLTEKGIEEQGSHDELMAKKGEFYKLSIS